MSDRRANGAAMEGGPSRPPRSPWAVGPVEAELNPPHQSRWGGGQGTAAKGSCLRFPVRRPPIPPDLNSETRPLRANPDLNSETRPLRANSPDLNSETRPLRATPTPSRDPDPFARTQRVRSPRQRPAMEGGPPRPPLAGIAERRPSIAEGDGPCDLARSDRVLVTGAIGATQMLVRLLVAHDPLLDSIPLDAATVLQGHHAEQRHIGGAVEVFEQRPRGRVSDFLSDVSQSRRI
jgi:hypothetical protein